MAGNITQAFKNKFINQFINDVKSNTSNYYISFGRNYSWPDDMNPPPANTSLTVGFIDVYRDMLFGKKISATDIAYMTKRVDWTSGTVYDIFDDLDPNLYDKQFFVMNSSYRVYKCLDNNYGAPSTIEPNSFGNNGDFNTPDGYKWKYMFTVNSYNRNKFMTSEFIPVIPDQNVVRAAERGAIHTILVNTSGNNYIDASGTIEQVISSRLFKLANNGPSVINGAYNLSTFYVVDAAGNYDDGHSTILNYVANASGKFVATDTDINVQTVSTLYYKICPQVQILGDGQEAFAVAHVNAVTTAIDSIEVINRGYDYSYGSVNIVANTNFGSGATARVVISPANGHGADAITELGCDTIGMSLETDTSDNLPDWIAYRQIGLLHNPVASANGALFNNTTFNQMLVFDIFNVFDIMPEGEIITGLTSGATGTVVYMSTTQLYVGFTSGTFLPFETLIGQYTGFTCSINAINSRDLVPLSGKLYYYRNFEPISRIGLNSEQVKIYFKI